MNPKHLLPLLLLALTACQPPQTVENTNLCNYLPPHSEKTRLDDEDAHRFDVAADRISAATAHGNDSKRKHCGQTWRSVASDDDLKTAVASTLGQDWNYRETLQQDGLTIALWETRSRFWPKQHYALTLTPARDGAPRTLRSTYTAPSSSASSSARSSSCSPSPCHSSGANAAVPDNGANRRQNCQPCTTDRKP